MYTINSAAMLKEAIFELEIKKTEQGRTIKEKFYVIKENLRPANIIMNTFDEVVASPKLRLNLLGAVAGLGAAYFSRRLLVGRSVNVFRNILGSVVQLGISAVVASKPCVLQNIGQTIVKRIFAKKKLHEIHSSQRN
jgi:hypothetical protein